MTQLISTESRPEVGLRFKKITSEMRERGVDAMLIASNANIYYTTMRYFRGYVYLTSEAEAYWFVVRPTGIEPDDRTIYIRKPELIPEHLHKLGVALPKVIGIEQDVLSWSECNRLAAIFPEAKAVNATPLLNKARMVKTPLEISLIAEDGVHQSAVYQKIGRLYKRDMTDVEFQIEIEHILRLEGSLGYLRTSGNLMEINMGSVIAGDNADIPTPYDFAMGGAGVSAALPGGASGKIIRSGESIMIDMNGCFNGYQSDMTRVWSLGELNDELGYKAHECSRRILRRLEEIALPGEEVSRLYEEAIRIVDEEELKKYFMGHRQQTSFIGHGVGIELNETPAITARCKVPLQENMVLAIEPKFVIPGVGAVGVENTYAVTPSGLKCLTPGPEEIQDLLA